MLTIGIHGGGIADGPDTALLLGLDRWQRSPRGGTLSVPPVAGERCLAHAGILARGASFAYFALTILAFHALLGDLSDEHPVRSLVGRVVRS
jgi:hypothetical protein